MASGSLVARAALRGSLGGVAQPIAGPPLVGTMTVINDGPGNPLDPHISGDLVPYTHALHDYGEVRYYDFFTASDSAIPTNGGAESLSKISGTTLTQSN